jgi:hypothetical protein
MPSPYSALWVYVLIVAVIFIAVGIVAFERNTQSTVPTWIWVVFIIGVLLIIVSFALYASYVGLGPAVYDTVRTNPGWTQRAVILPQ